MPQRTRRSESTMCSESLPATVPTVGRPARIGGGDADGPVELGSAQSMEERVSGPVLDKPEGARVREGQDGLAAPLGDHATPPVGDLLDRGVPAHRLEAPFTF